MKSSYDFNEGILIFIFLIFRKKRKSHYFFSTFVL